MATSLLFAILLAILILLLCISRANATHQGLETTFTATSSTTTNTAAIALSPPPPPPPQTISNNHYDQTFLSHTLPLGPILSHLGFNKLSMAAPSLYSTSTAWTGPSTVFAPSDSSLRTCFSCSIPNLLREHIVPGLFTIDYLGKLAFGTKIETLSPGRCVTVTSTTTENATAASANVKVFIGGVEITHPDLFNNGLIVIHGIQGYIAPLSPFSCEVERLSALTFPSAPFFHQNDSPPVPPTIMRLMLRDAMLRLRHNGFSILSLALRVKYAELVTLNNMTIFALDDVSVFSGSHSYISSVRFHILPNHLLTIADLERLPVGATLPTLETGQSLVVTATGGGSGLAMRINYVRIRAPEMMRNLKIIVHSVYLPFPRIHPTANNAAYQVISGKGSDGGDHDHDEACAAAAGLDEDGSCDLVVPMPAQIKPTVEIEDHHGL